MKHPHGVTPQWESEYQKAPAHGDCIYMVIRTQRKLLESQSNVPV
jgi:hypothetical protein